MRLAVGADLPVPREAIDRLKESLRLERRLCLDHDASLLLGGTPPGMPGSGRDRQRLAGLEGSLLTFDPSTDAAREDLKPLFLERMDVFGRSRCAGRDDDLELETSTPGVGTCLVEDSPIADDGILDDLAALSYRLKLAKLTGGSPRRRPALLSCLVMHLNRAPTPSGLSEQRS